MRTFSSFQRRAVETTGGQRLGRCHDLRGEIVGGTLRITGLCVGSTGWLAHFGVQRRRRSAVIPWEAVVRIEGRRIVVRDGSAD
jgi:sporulation protein YlmC with PRC-barrel domain